MSDITFPGMTYPRPVGEGCKIDDVAHKSSDRVARTESYDLGGIAAAVEERELFGSIGCSYPGECVMPGLHYTSECHTSADMEALINERDWEVFAAHFEKREGFKPNAKDWRVKELFHYFTCGAHSEHMGRLDS